MKKGSIVFLAVLCLALLVNPLYAQTPEITSGLGYLSSTQNPDGSWGSASAETEPLPATTAVVQALNDLGVTNTTSYSSATAWLASNTPDTTYYLAEKLLALSTQGAEADLLLSYADPIYDAWGGYIDFDINLLDTSLALQALNNIAPLEATFLNHTLGYILNFQNADGGWGFYKDDESNTFVSAIVTSALNQHPGSITIANALNKAKNYLISKRNSDGGFGSSPSTVYETSLAYMALAPLTTDNTILGGAVNYLKATQEVDGSWAGDAYSTALAIRALNVSTDKPEPPAPEPVPTTGIVSGKVVDGLTRQTLGGVTITLQSDPLITTTTDATGAFLLQDVPEGQQGFSLNLAGFVPVTYSVDVIAGAIVYMGELVMTTESFTGIIKGVVTDAATGGPLPGVTITVSGAYSASVLTGADGAYMIADATPGGVTVTVSLQGYYTVSGQGTVSAGGILTFNPQLSTEPPPATTEGSIGATVVDAATGQPIAGAEAELSDGTVVLTDPTGAFVMDAVQEGEYGLVLSASGYIAQTFNVVVAGGMVTDMQVVGLAPVPADSTTLKGVVTDALGGGPIVGATVEIAGTGLTTRTDPVGAYEIAGITLDTFDVVASAIGYGSAYKKMNITEFGTYTLDIMLMPNLPPTGEEQISVTAEVSTDRQSYASSEDVQIMATVKNIGVINAPVLVYAAIVDGAGNIVSQAYPASPHINLASGQTEVLTINWNTAQFLAGDYDIVLQVVYSNLLSDVMVEDAAVITITPTLALAGGIALSPPVTQADIGIPVSIKAVVRNIGNLPLSTGLVLEAVYNGTVVYPANDTLTDLPINGIKEIDFGSFVPKDGGNYMVSIIPVDGSVEADISKTLYVGPHATATFTVDPTEVFSKDATVTGKVNMTGVANATATSEDPLVPLIKDAIQKGVDWEQINALDWQNKRKCYGCHVQTQTLIGMELSRDKVVVDDNLGEDFLDYMINCQSSSGKLTCRDAAGFPVQSTVLFAWSLAYYHDEAKIETPILKALDYIITRQSTSGYWVSDHYYGTNDWWSDFGRNQPSTPFTAYTMIALAKAYELTENVLYEESAIKAAEYLLSLNYESSIVTAAHIVMGLKALEIFPGIQHISMEVGTRIQQAMDYIMDNQNPDAGWGRYAGDTSDAIPTSHAIYAMGIYGVSGKNTQLRSAAIYLLNIQNSDGTWPTEIRRGNTFPDRYFGSTTWAIISLPIALETVSGVQATLSLTFPEDIEVDRFINIPTETIQSGDETTYLWQMTRLTSKSKQIAFDLTLNGLENGEKRKVASKALISFEDSYTGNKVDIPIEIPSVTRVSPLGVDVTTDKANYSESEVVNITTDVSNLSPSIRNATTWLTVEDLTGNVIANVSQYTVNNIFPSGQPPLSGWYKRIELSIDHTKIDAALTDFPVLVHLSASSSSSGTYANEIFNNLSSYSDRKKIAVTTIDGIQRYVEIEKWDSANKEAWLWVKVPYIDSNADTTLYLYFDKNHADNSDFIGDTGDTSAQKVWASNYKAVYHMVEDQRVVKDSTLEDNHGTATADIVCNGTAGMVGDGCYFDGSGDYIQLPNSSDFHFGSNDFGVSFWFKGERSNGDLYQVGGWAGCREFRILTERSKLKMTLKSSTGCLVDAYPSSTKLPLSTWHYVTVTRTGSSYKIYVNGEKIKDLLITTPLMDSGKAPQIGKGDYKYKGTMDEIVVTNSYLTKEHIKASYHNQTDNLISFESIMLVSNVVHDPSYSDTWNTGSTLAGDYLVRAKLYDDGIFINEDTALFTIVADKTITSRVSTDKMSYEPGDSVAISADVTSASANYIFENLSGNLTVTDPQGQAVLTNTISIPMLVQGQIHPYKAYWDTTGAAKGTYNVTLAVFEGATAISTSSATFEVLGTTTTGAGLSGTLDASPDPVDKGNDLTLTYTINNDGNEDISALDVKVLLVNPQTQTVDDTLEATVDIDTGLSIVDSFTADTSGLTPDMTYIAVLTAQTSDMASAKTLASATFEVLMPAGLEITKAALSQDMHNVLVWLNYQWTSGKDIPDVTLIKQALNSFGGSYYIVFDKKDFQSELRNPYYTDYVILGNHHPIEGHFSEELREKVHAGRGLIFSMFQRQSFDEDVLGIKYTGSFSGLDHMVELAPSAISSGGTMQSYGRALDVQANHPTEVVGWIVRTLTKQTNGNTSGGGKGKKASTGTTTTEEVKTPGVIMRGYGAGKVVFYAFDLGLSSPNYSWFSSLLGASLAHVHAPTDPASQGAFRLVSVEITIKSLGGEFDLRVTETYPLGVSLYDPQTGGLVTARPWVMEMPLSEDETKAILYYALTPEAQGTYTLDTDVDYLSNGQYTYYDSASVDITVATGAPALLQGAIAELGSVTASGHDRAKIDGAMTYLAAVQVRQAVTLLDIEANIHSLLKAVESLRHAESVDLSAARLLIDQVLHVWEGKYYVGVKNAIQ